MKISEVLEKVISDTVKGGNLTPEQETDLRESEAKLITAIDEADKGPYSPPHCDQFCFGDFHRDLKVLIKLLRATGIIDVNGDIVAFNKKVTVLLDNDFFLNPEIILYLKALEYQGKFKECTFDCRLPQKHCGITDYYDRPGQESPSLADTLKKFSEFKRIKRLRDFTLKTKREESTDIIDDQSKALDQGSIIESSGANKNTDDPLLDKPINIVGHTCTLVDQGSINRSFNMASIRNIIYTDVPLYEQQKVKRLDAIPNKASRSIDKEEDRSKERSNSKNRDLL